MSNPAADQIPRLLTAYPQLFVRDVTRTAAFYREKLGFNVVYLYGEPPFYGLVERDGAGLNLRHVDQPVMDQKLRRKESLLSANIPVHAVEALFQQFKERGVEFEQVLKKQPWDTMDFLARDPDGNLICFASAAGKATG